jgi:hypothetical protein
MTLAVRLHPDRSNQYKREVLSRFLRRVAITDLLVISWAVMAAQLLRFGPDSFETILSPDVMASVDPNYSKFTAG